MGIFGQLGRKKPAPPRTNLELSLAYADWLTRNHPETAPHVVVSEEDPQDAWLTLTVPAGMEVVAYVDNMLRRVHGGEHDLDAMFAQQYTGLASVGEEGEGDGVLLPMLKTVEWLDSVRATSGTADEDLPAHAPVAGDLIVTYVFDEGGALRFLRSGDVPEHGPTLADVDARARENLGELLSSMEVHGGEGLFMLAGNGTFEATMVLVIARILGQLPLQGGARIAVPARDLLLIADTAFPDAVARQRDMARGIAETGDYPLTDQIFVAQDGVLTVIVA